MSKNRSKQVIEDKWGDRSNVTKTIVKKVIEGSLGYCANGPMEIDKSDFEGGMDTYAQKWKTAEICKRKSSGGLQEEKSISIVAPHHPKVNVGVVLIHQYYQQITR